MPFYKASWDNFQKWFARVNSKPEQYPQAVVEDTYFLPNFCTGMTIGAVMVIAQMLALVITLVTRRIFVNVFVDLVMISVFIQWIALASAATLCLARERLRQLPDARALIAAYLLLLAVTVIVGEAGLWVATAIGLIDSARPEWYSYFHTQNLAVSALVNALALRYFLAKHELKQRTLSEARARIQALQSRIRPTFLFNSMNMIASLTRSAPTKAEAAIEDMADVFRVMLGDAQTLVPVKNEIDVTKKYLNLEMLRLEDRLRVEWDIGKFPRKAVMPMLSMQPLFENAIYYGIEPSPVGSTIKVKMWEENEEVHIHIATILSYAAAARPHKDQDVALDNMRQRLETYYGDAAKLQISKDSNMYIIDVSFPARGGKI